MKKAIREIPKITGTVIKGFDCRARGNEKEKKDRKRFEKKTRKKSDMFREFFQCA